MMKKVDCRMIVGALSLIIIFTVALYLSMPVECSCYTNIRATVCDENSNVNHLEEEMYASFRIRGALAHMKDKYVVDELVHRYISLRPSCSEEIARSLLENVRIERKKDDGQIWTIEATAKSRSDADFTSEFYADSIIKYFFDESRKLEAKILAWFDIKMHNSRICNENIDELKKRRDEVIADEQRKALVIKKISVQRASRCRFEKSRSRWLPSGTVEKE
jgi:hypothetical protein